MTDETKVVDAPKQCPDCLGEKGEWIDRKDPRNPTYLQDNDTDVFEPCERCEGTGAIKTVDAPKFRKKPVVISATQWFDVGDHFNVATPPPHCIGRSDMRCVKCGNASGLHGWIKTLEGGNDGAQLVCPGDWIITGIKGENYPCKPDVFEKTYERVGAEVDNYVAYCKFVHHPSGATTIRTCDSDEDGAFKVYRHPATVDAPKSDARTWLDPLSFTTAKGEDADAVFEVLYPDANDIRTVRVERLAKVVEAYALPIQQQRDAAQRELALFRSGVQ